MKKQNITFLLIIITLFFAGCGVSSHIAPAPETDNIPAVTEAQPTEAIPVPSETQAPTAAPTLTATATPVPTATLTQVPTSTSTPTPTATPFPIINELSYVLSDDGTYYSVEGAGTFDGDELTIPAVYNGLPVLKIMPKAFESCTFLKKVYIAEGITDLGNGAFLNCSDLEYVSLPDSISSFGYFVFQSCSSLKEVKLPEGIKNIPDSTFAYCESYVIDIPESVETIQMSAYMGCKVKGELVISENVTLIEKYAFKDITGITSLTINSDADLIKYGSFDGLNALETLTAPSAVVGSTYFYQINVADKTYLTDGVDSRWDGATEDFSHCWGYALCKKHDAEYETGGACAGAYERLYKAIQKGETNVLCNDTKGVRGAIVYLWVRDDHPEIGVIVKDIYVNDVSNLLTIFYNDAAESSKLLEECNASLDEIKSNIVLKYGSIDNASLVQRAKEIHDYIINKKAYKESDYDQTIAGALSEDYTPVCMAYSSAFKWCCNNLGIQCEIVYGDINGDADNPHAWNMINYGEPEDYLAADYKPNPSEWYEMDLTWDDPLKKNVVYVDYSYFNVTTDSINKTRVRTYLEYDSYPVEKCSGTDYSYRSCINKHIFKD